MTAGLPPYFYKSHEGNMISSPSPKTYFLENLELPCHLLLRLGYVHGHVSSNCISQLAGLIVGERLNTYLEYV